MPEIVLVLIINVPGHAPDGLWQPAGMALAVRLIPLESGRLYRCERPAPRRRSSKSPAARLSNPVVLSSWQLLLQSQSPGAP